jgi:hypothetical protein
MPHERAGGAALSRYARQMLQDAQRGLLHTTKLFSVVVVCQGARCTGRIRAVKFGGLTMSDLDLWTAMTDLVPVELRIDSRFVELPREASHA